MEVESVTVTPPLEQVVEELASSTMAYVFGVFLALTMLLILANATTRKTMMQFLRYIGISVHRSPRVIKELKRKGFHFFGLSIPLIYIIGLHLRLLDRFTGSVLMLAITSAYFLFECTRLLFPTVNQLFERVFKGLMREKEKNNFTGSFFYLVGATVYCLLQPPYRHFCDFVLDYW